MRRLIRLLLLALVVVTAHAAAEPPALLALCYHDVVESEAAARADDGAVTVEALVRQLSWLDAAGYQPISLDTWAAARDGGPLPEKPVLLTFDDGYASFHRHVLPLLRLFEFPAVLAPVTSWIDAPSGISVPYGEGQVDRARFMTWAQIREAVDSGLVEVATHTHDLHRGVTGNPFGNSQPAAVTRQFFRDSGTYEPEGAYRARIRDDLERSVALIERHVGVRPRTVVWPYGAHNATATAAARALGLDFALTLDATPNTPLLRNVHRRLIDSGMDLPEFVSMARGLYPPQPQRAAHVDLDYVYDPDPEQQARNLDRLLDRIKALHINRVFLQAFADADGDGVADAVYFPNRHLPVRADLFNRVAWQLRTRSNVQVLAWMPVLAFNLPDPAENARLAVRSTDGSHAERYHRLSPFHPDARRIIREIYDDLGRYSHFSGVLFHDDAMLDETEDANPAAPVPPAPGTRAKTRHLVDFTLELADVLRRHQPALVTVRNLYARPVTEPRSERWFAQNLELFLTHYDYTAVMAMPYLEEVKAPVPWLRDLVARIAAAPRGLERTIFELQTRDWRTGAFVADAVLARHLDTLLAAGARHLAWYPDDFIADHPDPEMLRARVSLADHPARLP